MPSQSVAKRIAAEPAVVEMVEGADLAKAGMDARLAVHERNTVANMALVAEPVHGAEVASCERARAKAMAANTSVTDMAKRAAVKAHCAEVTASAETAAAKAPKSPATEATTMKTATTATKAAATGKYVRGQQ